MEQELNILEHQESDEIDDILKNGIKWQKEIDIYRRFKTLFILEGNINDSQMYIDETDNSLELCSLDNYLYRHFHEIGYQSVVFFNHIDGFSVPFNGGNQDLDNFRKIIKSRDNPDEESIELTKDNEERYSKFGEATSIIRKAMRNETTPVVVVMNLASRYITTPQRILEAEQYFYSELLLASKTRKMVKGLRNLIIIIADKSNDIPAWLYVDNPNSKVVNIPSPDKKIRKAFINNYYQNFYLSQETQLTKEQINKEKKRFVDYTDGFTIVELQNLFTLMCDNKIPLSDIEKATTLYKHGIKENPWNDADLMKRLPNVEEELKKRVKGQDICIKQAIDILTRSILGLSGLQHSSSKAKPKGVMFLSGPTGTGKTELAKALAEWLFGTEDACIRFDMSEYQQAHADQKLLGAPPGYVGYEAGGQLTNAVKANPFSVLLFDEIEKADASILDKFLQILEDGRMTDGSGETVFFSDCLIIFTSNLGIYEKNPLTGQNNLVVPIPKTEEEINNYSYEEYRNKIMGVIKRYFTDTLGRPEILNRIGENFIIFKYINENAAKAIMDSQIKRVANNLKKEKGINLVLELPAYDALYSEVVKNLENGGRGVGNMLEKHLINPLARNLSKELIINQHEIKNFIIKNILIDEENSELEYHL